MNRLDKRISFSSSFEIEESILSQSISSLHFIRVIYIFDANFQSSIDSVETINYEKEG